MNTLDPIWSEPISKLKLKTANIVNDQSSVRDCIDAMQSAKDPFLAILDGNNLFSGVFTERDVMNCYVGTNLADETLVIAVMNRKVVTVNPDATLREAIDSMGANRVSQMPVVDADDKLIGILTVEALWDHLGETFPDELLNLPPQMNRSIPLQRNGG
jgi:osmoprotectant transport system ATP-binding protein